MIQLLSIVIQMEKPVNKFHILFVNLHFNSYHFQYDIDIY